MFFKPECLKSSPPVLEMSDDYPGVEYEFKKKQAECHGSVPSIEDLLGDHPRAKKFKPFNEVEYSANIIFDDLKINKTIICAEMDRYYINDEVALFLDETRASTNYFENSSPFNVSISTRFDYPATRVGIAVVTSKLKAAKMKFNYCGVTYSLTAAIEVEFPELFWAMIDAPKPTSYTRKRHFVFWSVALMVDSTKYEFKVAFRSKGTKYECNIECEDTISGSNFIECFDFLSKYYKQQYILYDKTITPAVNMDYSQLKLTDRQLKIANSMVCADAHQEPICYSKPCKYMTNLVKFLSLSTVGCHMIVDLPIEPYSSFETAASPNTISEDLMETSPDDMFEQ